MKSLRLLAGLLALAGSFAAVQAADVKDVVVLDFTRMPRNADGSYQRAYDYAWNDWDAPKKVTQIPEKGLLLNHVGSKGVVGEDRGLDFRKHTKAKIAFLIGNGNEAEAVAFTLIDRDGTEQSWDINLRGQPRGAPLSVTLDLTQSPREAAAGKTAGLELKKLRTWRFQGNYQDKPLEIMIFKVTAVSQ